ncbi:MAG: hypothetical protein ACRDQ6_21890, partial [Pseudonocardiaceae bacterium]
FKRPCPVTQDVRLNDGEKVRVELRKKRDMITTKQWEPIEGIEGVGWVANAVLWSGANSGFVPLLDPRPLYFIDHGEHDYTHDASGIHLGQEDRLTFVGPSDHEVTLVLLDTRQGSPTLHNEVLTTFTPSALRHLKIPNGVAHRFEHLECVFTFNRPHVYLPEQGDYEPGNDVIDWPIGKLPPPVLEVYRQPAPLEFYQRQVAAQRELMLEPAMHATPTVIMTESADGGIVRVAFRKPSATAASTA